MQPTISFNLIGKKNPGQNYKNKLDCYISSHQHLKWCREITEKAAAKRLEKITAASGARTAMHAKRNAERAARKQSYARAEGRQ